MFLLTVMVLFGAGLLFSMEPLVGRLLIPYFGGAAHVWLTCLMFFQAMLLLGYLYAHLLARKLGFWHLLLLALPMVNLPLHVSAIPDSHAPLLTVLAILVLRVALPFIALSTTAVVAQAWLFRSSIGRHREPYPLYAASNAGSLAALLGYAFLVEPFFGVRMQSLVWSGAYIVYLLLVLITWFKVRPGKESIPCATDGQRVGAEALPPITYLRWFLLSASPSAFLLATTNYITLEVGSFPFVWVIPLALYLGSFIVTFRANGGVPRFLNIFWLELLLAGLSLYLLGPVYWLTLVGLLCVFFAICLVAHGTLYGLRPPGSHLTHFYLFSALGGWIGGALVSLVAPFVFPGLFKYPITLIFFGVLFWWHRDKAFTAFWPSASRLAAFGRLLAIGIIVFPTVACIHSAITADQTKFRYRNFYGTYRIIDESVKIGSVPVRKLVHGHTVHGAQLLDPSLRLTPITYYYVGGPISQAYELVRSPCRMAVVGLGSGTISTYAREGDVLTYYEIDPDNEKIARTWFTYLNECKGKVDVTVGDGRLSMQDSETDKIQYDIINIDAFTGDGIPTHLLTKEAISTYLDRLGENGIILFHISNRYYDLRPVLKSTAATLGLSGAINDPANKGEEKAYYSASRCVVLAVNPMRFQPLIDRGWIAFGNADGLKDVAPWTDDYINILASLVLRRSR
jgi:hypothetical protein